MDKIDEIIVPDSFSTDFSRGKIVHWTQYDGITLRSLCGLRRTGSAKPSDDAVKCGTCLRLLEEGRSF